MPAFHMLGLRESLRGYCFRMMQDFVVHLVFLQTIDQSFWDFHNRLRGKKYHFPRLSLVPGQSRWNAPFRIFAPSALSRLLKAAERCAFQDASAWQTRATIPAFWSAALLHRFRSTRCSYVSAIEKSAIKLRNSKTEHRREAYGVRKAYVWLYAKFAKTNMTRRLKWSLAGSTTRSTASSARSTRWRRFARNATAGLWDTVLKPTDKFSAASTAPEKPAKRN